MVPSGIVCVWPVWSVVLILLSLESICTLSGKLRTFVVWGVGKHEFMEECVGCNPSPLEKPNGWNSFVISVLSLLECASIGWCCTRWRRHEKQVCWQQSNTLESRALVTSCAAKLSPPPLFFFPISIQLGSLKSELCTFFHPKHCDKLPSPSLLFVSTSSCISLYVSASRLC